MAGSYAYLAGGGSGLRVIDVGDPSAPVDFPTFEDGLWGMKLLVKVIESVEKQGWVQTM